MVRQTPHRGNVIKKPVVTFICLYVLFFSACGSAVLPGEAGSQDAFVNDDVFLQSPDSSQNAAQEIKIFVLAERTN